MKKALLLTLITIISFNFSKASHTISVELNYECLGNSEYKISYIEYRDCSSFFDPGNPTIDISSSCGSQSVELFPVDLSPNDPDTDGLQDTSYLCSDILDVQNNINLTTCADGDYPGLRIHLYEAIVTLDPCSDWFFFTQECCRNPAYDYPFPNDCNQSNPNGAVTRVVNQTGTGFSIFATMDNSDGNCNSSPEYSATPRAFVCQGQRVEFDNSAVDSDGDSLVYVLMTPFTDAFPPLTFADTIEYEAGYSSRRPITLVPNTTFDLNSNSGILEFYPKNFGLVCSNPDSLEQSSFATQILQYRDGILVGTTMRDIQIITMPGCDPLEPINLGIQTVSLPESFINDTSARICAGDSLEFSIRISDFENASPFKMSSTLENMIPGSEFTVDTVLDSVGFHAYGNFLIKPNNEDAGNYSFKVTVENDGCPIEVTRVFSFNLEVVNSTQIEIDFDTTCVNQQDTITLTASGGENFVWSVLDVQDSTWADCDTCPEITITPPRTLDYVVVSDLDVPNCPNTDTMTVTRVQPPIPLPDFCYNDSLKIEWKDWTPTENIMNIWNDDEDLDNSSIYVDPEGDSTYFYFAQDTVDFSDSIVCVWMDTNTVSECPVIVPNIFTPNGDLYNEYFVIENIQTEIWNLQIYNRWGKTLIKEYRDYQNDWNGEGLNDGTYFYRLYSQQGAEIVEFKGWVVIAR